MQQKILQEVEALFPRLIEWRRHLHQYPELSFEEVATGRYIAEQLKALDIPCQHGIAENGVVGIIEGQAGPTIALRADFDALPIREANEVPYRSKNPGIMHACGHDAHTASLLGAAALLQTIKKELKGTIRLIFQPGEEKLPGGASLMINEGVLKNPRPMGIFGQHVHPPLAAGKVGFRPGRYMASADELYVTLRGKGGHGALPQDCVDPILMAAQVITALQQVVSRNADPVIPSVLTFGKIYSNGGATNIIPNEVYLEGTFRTMDEEWRFRAHDRLCKLAEGIACGMGGSCDFNIVVGYPNLFNDKSLTQRARTYAEELLGKEKVVDLPVRLTAEDFSYYSQEIPACFYRLGTGNPEKGIVSPVHTNTFDIDEEALKIGAALPAWLAFKELLYLSKN